MNKNNFLRIFLTYASKKWLNRKSECFLLASALLNIAAHQLKVVSILKVKTDVIEQYLIKILFVIIK